MRLRRSLATFFVTITCFVVASCGSKEPSVLVDKAVPYQVISTKDFSFAGRKRLVVSITAPTAQSADQRAQTALKAAVDLQRGRDADEVSADLEVSEALDGQGFALAIADYAPDGGGLSGSKPFSHGTWEVQVSAYVVSPEQAKIANLWYENENRFQVGDGFGGTRTNEKALKKYIARVVHARSSDVNILPLMRIITTRHEYDAATSTPN